MFKRKKIWWDVLHNGSWIDNFCYLILSGRDGAVIEKNVWFCQKCQHFFWLKSNVWWKCKDKKSHIKLIYYTVMYVKQEKIQKIVTPSNIPAFFPFIREWLIPISEKPSEPRQKESWWSPLSDHDGNCVYYIYNWLMNWIWREGAICVGTCKYIFLIMKKR